MNKSLIIILVAVAVIILAGAGWMMYNNNQVNQNTPTNTTNNNQNQTEGTLYFSFKDAAADMGSISAINMTVDKVYVHSQSQGWVTLSTNPQTFSLLALKASGNTALMAKANLKADTYDQMWFHVSSVMVTETGKTAKQATMPSADFKMLGSVKVVAGSNSMATLDVLADQSLHKTDKGEFIFAPVVEFEGRSNASVTVDTNNMVTAANGTVDSTTSAGMDINGEVKTNFKLNINSALQINAGVVNYK